MKLTSKQVKFQIAAWWPTRRRMTFVGGHSTLQLLETALIVEGYKQRFFFPVLDRFFQMPLSEWTTVTVPYSRILQAKHDSRFTVRLITGLVLWSPTFLLALGFLAGGGLFTPEGLLMMGLVATASLLLTLYACVFRLGSRNWLMYREADGGRALLMFRIPSKKRRLEFEAALERNRAASRSQVEPVKDSGTNEAASFVPLLVLTLMTAGMWLGKAIVRYFRTVVTQQEWLDLMHQGLLGVTVLALGFAIWSRHLGWRLLAGLMLILLGVVPIIEASGKDIGREGPTVLVACVFHVVLALIIVFAVRTRGEKEAD
jgi:hypothetical protein